MKMNQNIYNSFLDILRKHVSSDNFKEKLVNVQKVDEKHGAKKINTDEIIKILDECPKEIKSSEVKNVRIFLDGNPEIILQAVLEAIRLDFNIEICMYDFCYGQDLLIINEIDNICKNLSIESKRNLMNFISDNEIIKNICNFDRNIVIGNPNLYNKLYKLSDQIEINTYGIFEMYSDCEEFEIVKDKIYDVTEINQYFIEDYSELSFDDAIKFINKDGYRFCVVILSRDENKIKRFKDEINSKNIIVNENPFKKIKFEFDF